LWVEKIWESFCVGKRNHFQGWLVRQKDSINYESVASRVSFSLSLSLSLSSLSWREAYRLPLRPVMCDIRFTDSNKSCERKVDGKTGKSRQRTERTMTNKHPFD
jgi:hypothetical protein